MLKYRVREIPPTKMGKGEFAAEQGWELFAVWIGVDDKTWAIFEKREYDGPAAGGIVEPF